MAAPAGGESPGLFAALRTTATTLVATVRTRVELAGSELETLEGGAAALRFVLAVNLTEIKS